MASELRRPDGRLHIWVALLAVLVVGALVFLASTPEPCTDRTTTICGAAPRTAP